MNEEERLKQMKEIITMKIDRTNGVGIIADIYASIVGCKDCPFIWSCHKKVPCSKSIINYIGKGEVL